MNVISRATFVAVAVTTALLLMSPTTQAQHSSPAEAAGKAPPAVSTPTIAEAATTPATGNRGASRVIDVALQEDGVIRGRVLHADGSPIDGSRVVLRKGERIVAAVVSESNGQFSVKGLTSGVYQIETPTGHGMYRFWTSDAAPPAAMTHALLVSKEPLLRGQFGYFTPQETFTLAVGAAGLAVGVISLVELEDQDDQLNRIIRQVTSP